MKKIYKANTNISINVVLKSKKNLHISFTPLSNGSSTFTTDNEDIMTAIEQHYKFGTLFRLLKTIEEDAHAEQVPTQGDEVEKDVEENETGKPVMRKVQVSDLAAAKDFLADTFGISRTSLRSMKSITEQATAHGIEFEGLS